MVIVFDSLIFIFILTLTIVIIKEAVENHVVDSIGNFFMKKSAGRKDIEEEKVMEDGYGQESSVLYRLDLALYQAGISKKIPFMVSEVFILITAFLCVGAFVTALIFIKNIIAAFCIAAFLIFLEYLLVEVLLIHNSTKIEEEIVKFTNLLENYSKSSDDIVTIMENTWSYLNEPLRSAIKACCVECRTSGDTQTAFKRLELAIRYRHFSELVRNLEMCSRYNADYSAVIHKSRDIIRDYISQKEQRKQLANTSRLNICILYLGAIIVIRTLEGIGEHGILSVVSSSGMGYIIMAAGFAIILYSARQMIVMGRK